MNKNGCEAVLSYLIQQLNLILQDMNISDESIKVLTTSLKQFYFSEILFNDAKNTFLSQEPMRSSLSISSQNDCKKYQTSIISYPGIPPMAMQPPSNNTMNFISKPFNSSNLMFSNHPPIPSSSFPNMANQQANTNFNSQTNDNSNVGSQELMKLLNRVSLLKMIDDTPIPAKTKPNDFSKKTRPWSLKEDNRLLGAIMRFGLDNWSKVSKFVGNNRTRGQCSQRWSRGLNPSISRFEWSPQEDSTLLNYVKIHGNKKWSKISSLIGNRSDVQCRYRYKQLIKKRARSQTDLGISPEGQTDLNDYETTESFKESNSNSNTNETEESYSNTEDSINDEKHAQVLAVENNQPHNLSSINPYHNTDFNVISINNIDTDYNYPSISNTNQIMHFPNRNYSNFMMNKPPNQNIKVERIIFPMPNSDFHKQIPSLTDDIDIDTFLSKFKE